jgi:hypothetical protein
MHSQPKENIEKNDMQAKIDGMTTSKTCKMFPRRFGSESIAIGKEIIAHKTNQISYYIGNGSS